MVDGITRAASRALTPADRAGDVGERGLQRGGGARLRDQAQRDLGEDRQRAFGSDQQLRQVVTDHVLHGLRAGADDLAGRQHRLQRQHIAARGAVLHRPRPARALGDVAAQRRNLQAGRIGRIEQPARLDGVLQLIREHIRLDDGELVVLVDLEDAIEALHREDDPASDGYRPAGIAGAGAAHDQRHAVRVAEARNGGDLIDVPRQQHQVGWCAAEERVGPVLPARGLVVSRPVGADDGDECRTERRVDRHAPSNPTIHFR